MFYMVWMHWKPFWVSAKMCSKEPFLKGNILKQLVSTMVFRSERMCTIVKKRLYPNISSLVWHDSRTKIELNYHETPHSIRIKTHFPSWNIPIKKNSSERSCGFGRFEHIRIAANVPLMEPWFHFTKNVTRSIIKTWKVYPLQYLENQTLQPEPALTVDYL